MNKLAPHAVTLTALIVLATVPLPEAAWAKKTPPENVPPQFAESYRRAVNLLDQGNYSEAKQVLAPMAATPWGQTDIRLQCLLAESYFHDEDAHDRFKLAEAAARKALGLSKLYGMPYRILASIELEREQYQKSVDLATQSLACQVPDNLGYWIRARALRELHKRKEALADITAYIDSKKKPKITQYALKAELLQELGRLDEAIATYKAAMPLARDWAELQIVRCLETQNKVSEAVKQLTILIAQNPLDDDAYYLRAQLMYKTKEFKKAIADYTKAIELEPLSRYYKERAAVYDAFGQHDLAKKDLADAQKSL